jgi:hypothetical protein
MSSASYPAPQFTAKYRTPSEYSTLPKSIVRVRPRATTRAAFAGFLGSRRLPARRLPVPPGMSPSGMSQPISPATAFMLVPSPP